MQKLFLELVQLSLTGSILALAVMLVRIIFRKAPKWVFCLLWGFVAVRLIFPISLESSLSLMPERLATGQVISTVGDRYVGDVDIIYESDADYSDALQAGRQPVYADNSYYVVTERDSYNAPPTVEETVYPVLSWVWLAGMVLMVTYAAVSFLVLNRKMEEATHLRENIWQCERVRSPFVLGAIHPRIYLPYQIDGTDMQHVIAHEQAHIRRRDHWWKPIGFLVLSIHWFNPVMWLSYILLCRDIEAACDEKVIEHMSKDEKRAYSTALLNCSVHRRMIAACPLAFGETGVKERIKHVMNYKKPAFWIILLAVIASAAVGVFLLTDPVQEPEAAITPIEETYEYSVKSKSYVQPAAVMGWAEKDALMTETEDGTFFCFTSDTAQADDFINAQRTLLAYLKNQGMQVTETEYYGTDYGYCFSESEAYVDLASVRTWQQVLVTLQAVWGDYTDYGYVYAMANAIAEELGWQTDPVSPANPDSLAAFFTSNPAAVHLLYPSFTTKLASEETVSNCKTLARQLFEEIDWQAALKKPAEEQLDAYYAKLGNYAQTLGISFVRQNCGYAYYGEKVKLRIMTTYAEMLVDANYVDIFLGHGDEFSNYAAIYETANNIDDEITEAVQRMGLEEKVGVVSIKWLDSQDSDAQGFLRGRESYFSSTHTIYVTSTWRYMHEYYRHIAYVLKQRDDYDWQTAAFCELGASHSVYSFLAYGDRLMQNAECAELFAACAGRAYEPGRDDFYEIMDILCYAYDYYELDNTSADSINSFSRYLSELYTEEAVFELYLYPETVEAVTGKTWETLAEEWEQHILEKYAGTELPDWVDA